VKLVANAVTGRRLGGQIVGVERAAKRIDVLAAAIWGELRRRAWSCQGGIQKAGRSAADG
jgi:hypothetical protein